MPETLAALPAGRLKELDTKVVDGIIVKEGKASAGDSMQRITLLMIHVRQVFKASLSQAKLTQ